MDQTIRNELKNGTPHDKIVEHLFGLYYAQFRSREAAAEYLRLFIAQWGAKG